MSSIKILADSTCDLTKELIEAYDISILPLMISLGANSLKDGVEITPDEIYQWSNANGETPKTAAPTIGDAVDFMKPFVEKEMDLIFFGISEAMSATCNVLRLAAEELGYKQLYVVDSKNLSTGIGLQILRAAELATKGYSTEEILTDNHRINEKVRSSFVVDTLTFLYRGGRCSGITALLANTLKLKPEIVVINGKMEVAKKYRGNQKSVIMKYVKEKEKELMDADTSRVFITHSGCPEDVIKDVKDYLHNLQIFKEVIVTRAGGVISSHCGPNTLGILYISN
ncbi:DegV family protein [Mobilitalea sibirica]|uniref:DegV family protein n=1 Tax=Mobilitalea sibirica TaxID=1462919 RepID=A0A8J7H149_9FIRM|nr:DegV family protein [Mobilitalea sibirica]MBH1942369.1 DegV family protein [Mobilitalea sibirica]